MRLRNTTESDLIEVLTGFKFIGQKILEFEETGKGTLPLRYGGELWLPDGNIRER